jgi:hypothetical protein
MESTGVAGGVQISEDTHRLLNPETAALFQRRSELEVKGKGRMSTWVGLMHSGHPTALEAAAGLGAAGQ